MHTQEGVRIEPAPEVLAAAQAWLEPVRAALGPEFRSAYLTGSVLSNAFDPAHSHINVLVIAKHLDLDHLDALGRALPRVGKHGFEPLFVTRGQIEQSLDVFPVEWLDIQERNFRLEGEDVFSALEIPREPLRMQCERELGGKHLRLRQAYVMAHGRADQLTAALRAASSGLSVLFRTLLRLRGEFPPAEAATERLAELYHLDAAALLAPHLLRYSKRRPKHEEIQPLYRKFLVELDRLIAAVDGLKVA